MMLREEIRNEVGETVRDSASHVEELELLEPYIGSQVAIYDRA